MIMNSLGSLLGNAAGELDTSARPAWMTVIMPLGISYYTFSMVGYLADVYWRKDKAEKNFLKFLTWVLSSRRFSRDRSPDIRSWVRRSMRDMRLTMSVCALACNWRCGDILKKLVIADRLSIFVNSVFGNVYGESGSLIFVIAAIFWKYPAVL